jgi:hypothetical protein
MIKRLIWALTAIACLVSLAGCATSPSTYRVVAQVADDGKPAHWLLPPSADAWSSFRWIDSVPSRGFYIDLPLRQSACAYYAKFPEDAPKGGALQAELVPVPSGAVLRMKSTGTFLDDTSLRAAWFAWWAAAKDAWPGKCIGIDQAVMEQILVERRPLRFSELLRLYYGFEESTRSVILRPGTTVCASDVPNRAAHATARFSASGETCATLLSDGSGGAVFGPLAIPLGYISAIDTSKRIVHPIASWAELPHRNLVGHQFILRYPKGLPTNPNAMPLPTDLVGTNAGHVPLLIAVDTRVEGSVARAMQCVRADDDDILDVCGTKGFEASRCGGSISASDPLAELKNRPPKCFRFGERGVITPRITVTINGAPVEVLLGTTLGAALERLAPPFPHALQPRLHDLVAQAAGQAAVSGIRVMRMFEGKPVAVDLSGAGASALGLALLPGDQLSW